MTQLTVLSLFERIGKSIIQISEVKLLLSELLEKRSKYWDVFSTKKIRLSDVEIEILCILLKVIFQFLYPWIYLLLQFVLLFLCCLIHQHQIISCCLVICCKY